MSDQEENKDAPADKETGADQIMVTTLGKKISARQFEEMRTVDT